MYRLINFDANGTLLKLKYPVGQIYSAIASGFGIESDASKVENGFRRSWVTMNQEYPNFGVSSIGWRNWWKKVVFRSFRDTHEGDGFSEKSLEPVADRLIRMFGSDEGWSLADGCVETLDSLKSKNTTVGVISNFDPRLHDVLKALKIDGYFEYVITSYDVNIMKPDIRIFKLAEELSKITFKGDKKKEILHVGDKLEFDYFGPIKAGWDAAIISKNKNSILSSDNAVDSKKVFNTLFEFEKSLIHI